MITKSRTPRKVRRNSYRHDSIKSKDSELNAAVKLVSTNYTADGELTKIPLGVGKRFRIKKFGQLFAFTNEEVSQLTALQNLIARYVLEKSPTRPLCLAVFGPPGSGKSFAVKQIRKMAEAQVNEPRLKLPLTVVNLTQVSDSIELGRVIARIAGEQDEDTVPIIFFDEFDAPRNSAPYGWLQWFLAPMHDGEFLHEGATIRLRRAVYVFAGGTADTMTEFSAPQLLEIFRAAKGPDFISRLRGYLDVKGPNAEPRSLRRAILLRNELQGRTVREEHTGIRLQDDVGRALLGAGRYRHGARSIAAIVDLSDFRNDIFGWNALPEDHLVELHVDRGPLDSKLIGGSVALSGYPVRDVQKVVTWWLIVARKLWQEGATLSFAGSWQKGTGGILMRQLAHDLKNLPVQPSRTEERRDRPSPWLISFLSPRSGRPRQWGPREQARYGLQLVRSDYLTRQERTGFGSDTWSPKVVEYFRRRLAASEACVARFAVAGSTRDYESRVPGIAEEIMLTLALQRPIYVAGGCGGAAKICGGLLGLSNPRTEETSRCFQDNAEENSKLVALANKLRPGPWISLPITPANIERFLKKHAIGGRHWPDNGLSIEENRRLFVSTRPAEVAALVVKGLRRRFDFT